MTGSGENRALYEQVILEHNKKPRNFREMEDADQTIEAYNPLCGDHFTVYLKMDGDTVSDVSFMGSGCAISKASASLMTTLMKGQSRENAEATFHQLHDLLTSNPEDPVDEEGLGKLRVLAGVREYPVRIKCATLAWHALISAFEGKDAVSTE
ncbi:MAG: Fe-S cluster assembly sulfur transfer protein SufU [Candidatus Hydrogenedentota bacterium]